MPGGEATKVGTICQTRSTSLDRLTAHIYIARSHVAVYDRRARAPRLYASLNALLKDNLRREHQLLHGRLVWAQICDVRVTNEVVALLAPIRQATCTLC